MVENEWASGAIFPVSDGSLRKRKAIFNSSEFKKQDLFCSFPCNTIQILIT
jgi:hypothetical protein